MESHQGGGDLRRQDENKTNDIKDTFYMMRFKTGLCLKSSLVLALVLFSVILLKKKDVKDVSDIHSVGREDNTRNFTKNSKILRSCKHTHGPDYMNKI